MGIIFFKPYKNLEEKLIAFYASIPDLGSRRTKCKRKIRKKNENNNNISQVEKAFSYFKRKLAVNKKCDASSLSA